MNKEVEAHFRERLDWLVEQLHLHYEYEYADGRVLLERRDPLVSFDGMWVRRAPLLPNWMLDRVATCACETREQTRMDLAEAFFEGLPWCIVPGVLTNNRRSAIQKLPK